MTDRPAAAARVVALGGLGVFVATVLVEHALTPSLDPARHMISEYANAGAGVVMTVGFAAWAGSLAATAAWTWRARRRWLLVLLLVLAALGMVLTACFPTQTVAGLLPPGTTRTTTGALHDLGSGLTSLALLAGVVVSVVQPWPPRTFRVRAAVLVVAAVLVDVALLAVGHEVGGIRQRVLVAIGCGWQLLVLGMLAASSRGTGERRPLD